MRVTDYLTIGLLGLVGSASGLITDAPICQCQTSDCCNVDDSTVTKFTGATGVQLTYPDVSLTGKYTVINQLQYNETSASDYNTTQDYQYVVWYDNDFKTAFDRNLFFYTGPSQNISCTESHVYIGDPATDYFKKLDLIEQTDGTNTYCTIDVVDKLTIAEINTDAEVYFAFNRLVNEKTTFNIGYDMAASGLIVPISDINVYPYVIKQNSVFGTDEFGGGEFYIDLRLNVSDVDSSTVAIPASCLSVDELMSTEAYWLVPGGTNCPVTVLVNGAGDLEDTVSGRTYHLQIKQTEYETCSVSTRESGGELHFDFRLVLPIDNTLTDDVSDDGEACFYFAENLHVQNVTISMDQDVSSTIDANYITDFEPTVTSLTPVECTDYDVYPTPHSKLKIEITATFPDVNAIGFTNIGVPNFGESWEYNAMVWDDPAGEPNYVCTDNANGAGAEDDTVTCVFKFISTQCERMYETSTGECAFERNTTRFVTGFQIEQEITGGLLAMYNGGPINSGIDNTVFTADTCDPPSERAVVDVTDLFEVSIDLRNYYLGEAVDWDNTTLLTMKDDMIGRLKVTNSENTPTEFQDLSLIIKTATVTLTNPTTDEQITSYTFSVNDKKDFMNFGWTPYYEDPRFCAYYNADATGDKCETFFQDDRLNANYHNAAWVLSHEVNECQRQNTLVNDTKNTDHFLFTPREWFRDNVNGLVKMTVTLSGSVHQCTGARRMLSETSEGAGLRSRALTADPTRDVLYVSDQIIVTFVTDGDGSEHVEVTKPTTKTWWEESQTAIIIGGAVIGLIILIMLFTWVQRRNEYDSLGSGFPVVVSASRPDF